MRQLKRYIADVELYHETEKLDEDFSHGARLLSRLTNSSRKHDKTIEREQIRRSTGADKDSREGMIAGVKTCGGHSREPWEWRTPRRKDMSRSFFTRRSKRRPGQPMAERVNVLEKAVLDMKAGRLNVELKSMGWDLFEKSSSTLERQERVLGAAEGEYEFAAARGALPDTIIRQEKRSVPDRKPGQVTDGKRTILSEIDAADLVTGRQAITQPIKLTPHDAEEDPNSEEEESCEEESDLTTAFEREMDELASVVEELEDILGVQDVEVLRKFSESVYEGPATIRETHAKLREKTRNSHAAFGSRHASLSSTGRGKRQDET